MKKHNIKEKLKRTIVMLSCLTAFSSGCSTGFYLDRGLREESITPYIQCSEIDFYLKEKDKFDFYAPKKEDKINLLVIDPKNDIYKLDFRAKDWKKVDALKLEEIVKKRSDLKKVKILSHDVPCYTNPENVQRTAIAYKTGESEKSEIYAKQLKDNPNRFIIYTIDKKIPDAGNGGDAGAGGNGAGGFGGAGGSGGDGAGGAGGGGSGGGGAR
ncbi:MAG: hypothetical protein ABIA78_01860 [archaeon]